MINSLSAMVLTHNEAANLERTLSSLTWVEDVLVVDSFSNDETLAIAARFPNVRCVQRAFDSFASQCNFGLSILESEWVLSVDADYVLTPEITRELMALPEFPICQGFRISFSYCIHGHPLRSTLYPPRVCLYRRLQARYQDDGHGHHVCVEGTVAPLTGKILHDDRKPLSRWLSSQEKYAALECQKLAQASWADLGWPDRLRKTMILAPLAAFVYCLFFKGLLLDGWRGWFYTLQRVLAEVILALHLIDRHLRP